MTEPSAMGSRPPIQQISYLDADGNQREYIVGRGFVTAIRETNEAGEFCYIPWVEVWAGETLLARFSQNKLERIIY